MAFNGSEQNSTNLYVGYATVKVNGVSFETNNDKSFVVFQIEEPTKGIKTKLSFPVKAEVAISSKSDKKQFVDRTGNFQWKEKPESTEYFDATTAKAAGKGEENLTRFIKDYANVKKNDDGRLDSFKAVASGDLTEIESLLKQFPKNNVGVMFIVRDNKYQGVYNARFERGWVKEPKNIIKAIKADMSNTAYYGEAPYLLTIFNPELAPKPNDEIPSTGTLDLSTNTLGDMIPENFPMNTDFPIGNDNIIRDENGNELF